jgi:adenylate cyclase
LRMIAADDHLLMQEIMLGKKAIPTDQWGRVVIPFRGKGGSFPYVSALDVIAGKKEALELVKDKIIFVGTSALGMGDMRATPVQSVYPGVEVHANITDAIINRTFPVRPPWTVGAEFVLILVIGMVAVLVFPFLSPITLTIFATFTPLAIVCINAWVWTKLGLVISFVICNLMVVLLAMINMAAGFFAESRSKQKIKYMFGQYVPSAHVEKMSGDAGDYAMAGESREMSVLFSDIRNFTSISESLHAAELKNLLNQFLTPMTKVIFDNGGTVDKYVGDMVMAFWGAPLADEKHRTHAIAASLTMVEEAKNLRQKFVEIGLPAIEIGIGINSGMMNVGDMGSTYRRAYTVLGDAVNLASRLESLTKYYGVSVIVGQQTCSHQFEYLFRVIDKVKVKGKDEAIEIFEPIGLQKTLSKELKAEVDNFHDAMKLYFKMKWKPAIKEFKYLIEQYPERKLYQVYLERVKEFRDNPPGKKWDGVYIRTEK